MRYTNWLYVELFLIIIMLDSVVSYSMFRDVIPNGWNVPNPCNSTETWNGVGHHLSGGGGARNPFGQAFDDNRKVWNEALCRLDSDGDGRTNGEELGDPNCIWTEGKNPAITDRDRLSHPGVCEPLNSERCMGRSNFMIYCKQTTQKECDVMDEDGVFKHTVTLPETTIPAKKITYMCMKFEFPTDNDYHIVAVAPHIGNVNIVHHMLMYGCKLSSENKQPMDKPYDCFMGDLGDCTSLVGAWTLGMGATCFNPNAGIRVGSSDKGFKTGLIQLHWNNPTLIRDKTDNSGLDLYLTANRRPNDAGVLMFGQRKLVIPPKEDNYSIVGKCSSMCTKEYMKGPVYLTGAIHHMHNLGKAAESKVTSPDNIHYLANDKHFDHNVPVYHSFTKEVKMQPGDELSLTCHYDSSTQNKTTIWGIGVSQEMCYSVLMYYPKENMDVSLCQAIDDIGPCEFGKPLLRNCNISALADNVNNPDILALTVNCQQFECRKECMEVVKRVNKHPCFHGDVRKIIMNEDKTIDELKPYSFSSLGVLSRLTSCDKELASEEQCKMEEEKSFTGSAPPLSVAAAAVIVMMLTHCL